MNSKGKGKMPSFKLEISNLRYWREGLVIFDLTPIKYINFPVLIIL